MFQNLPQKIRDERSALCFADVTAENPAKNGLSSVPVSRYRSFICTVFVSDFLRLWSVDRFFNKLYGKAGMFFVACLVAAPMFAHAQFLGNLSGVEIVLRPDYPQPNQTVEARVTSPTVNLQSATIVWLINGEVRQQSQAGITFFFTSGDIGNAQRVSVLVKTIDGQSLSDTVTIRPAEVVLLWEADTWTPPFYKGRAIYTSGSRIKIEASAYFKDQDGTLYTADELIYTWSRNGTVLKNISGLGASSRILEGPKFYGNDVISVEVTTPSGSLIANSAALITTEEPDLLLYESDPLIGIKYYSAISNEGSFYGTAEPSVAAAPYFMDAQRANDASLTYRWKVNGTEVAAGGDLSYVTLRFNDDENLSARMELTVEHARHLLQEAKNSWLFQFEGSVSATPFGL
jgi:hypothetical protein